MQELLIERDLRDVAEASMLRHAETGLWWAVKTSRRLSTTSVCICTCVKVRMACVDALVFVLFVIMFTRPVYVLRAPYIFMHVQCYVEALACGIENKNRSLL